MLFWAHRQASLDSLQDAFEPQGFDPQVDERTFTLAMADATAAVFAPVLADVLQARTIRGEPTIRCAEHARSAPNAGTGPKRHRARVFPDVAGALAAGVM
jgi:hypothetical protein